MKFSYPLLKKLVPALPSKTACLDALTMHAFEAEDIGGPTIDISVTPNRYADAASHWGIARELAAILNTRTTVPQKRIVNPPQRGAIRATIRSAGACPRYMAYALSVKKHTGTPKWMKDVLVACGLRPINLVVDITNYVMLETGQPLHAFDADAITNRAIVVRNAHDGEEITSIDGKRYRLQKDDLVIADAHRALGIAGIKGGHGSEITGDTKEIILESANFEPTGVYRTSRRLRLATDASARFGHGMSPELAAIGGDRAVALLVELAGAKLLDTCDVYPKPQGKKTVLFNINRHNTLIGSATTTRDAAATLKRLGFSVRSGTRTSDLRVDIPPLRLDVERHEDISEEIARIGGYEAIVPRAPTIAIRPATVSDDIRGEENIRRILSALGYDEVRTHSFIAKRDEERAIADLRAYSPQGGGGLVEMENPISEEFWYLRPTLSVPVRAAAEENAKHGTPVRIFETGAVFASAHAEPKEDRHLGIALLSNEKANAIELKGICEELLKRLGIVEFFFREESGVLRLESDHTVVGMLTVSTIGRHALAYAELRVDALLQLAEEEREYEPLPKFPSVMRDVSFVVNADARIGPMVEAIQNMDVKEIADVDVMDTYQDEAIGDNRKSVTFRIVFRSDDRTLTDGEVDQKMTGIVKLLEETFSAEIR
ncbi:MAG: phenylalanine--tRNA ligase subunit beta [Candidatus Liptonbacteria bacterium]|nr:phenylalanine--tRNA ligase subunit beta [Candidatus Liptonbacteria bacterium]